MAAVQGCSWQGCDESRASLEVLGEMLGCLGDRADGSGINNFGAVKEFETRVQSWTDTANHAVSSGISGYIHDVAQPL